MSKISDKTLDKLKLAEWEVLSLTTNTKGQKVYFTLETDQSYIDVSDVTTTLVESYAGVTTIHGYYED